MKLKDWIKKEGLNCNRFASLVGVSYSVIYCHLKGTRRMSVKMATKIAAFTGQEVTRDEILFDTEHSPPDGTMPVAYHLSPYFEAEVKRRVRQIMSKAVKNEF